MKKNKKKTEKKSQLHKQENGDGVTSSEEHQEETVNLSKSEYDALVEARNEFEDKFLRTAAEYDNYKKRVKKEKMLWERGVYKEMLRDILSIYNSVTRGLEADDGTSSGLKALKDQIISILDRNRVMPIEAKGKQFDTDYHESLFTEETEEFPDKTVLEEIEQGYIFDGTVLIPSKVKVSRVPSAEEEKGSDPTPNEDTGSSSEYTEEESN